MVKATKRRTVCSMHREGATAAAAVEGKPLLAYDSWNSCPIGSATKGWCSATRSAARAVPKRTTTACTDRSTRSARRPLRPPRPLGLLHQARVGHQHNCASSVRNWARTSGRQNPSSLTPIQSRPVAARRALICGPSNVASLTCQYCRAPHGEPVVGSSGLLFARSRSSRIRVRVQRRLTCRQDCRRPALPTET